jgi:7 transmembrane receptor (rhodopsin family)
MIVPIEAHTSALNYASTAIGQANLTSAMNLTTDELCAQLKANLTELQQSQFDWASYGCTAALEHSPQLTDNVILKVIVLSIMGILSLVGNTMVIWNIQKNRASRRALRHSCSAIYALILHLSVADILVTFFCIIGEALWSFTVEWLAGDIACKLVKIFQMFALYLSTNVLVLIGIDRWVAVKYPMKSKSLNTSRFLVRRLGTSEFDVV